MKDYYFLQDVVNHNTVLYLIGSIEKSKDSRYFLRIKSSDNEIYWEEEFANEFYAITYLYFTENKELFDSIYTLILYYLRYSKGTGVSSLSRQEFIDKVKPLLYKIKNILHPHYTLSTITDYLNEELKNVDALIYLIDIIYPKDAKQRKEVT